MQLAAATQKKCSIEERKVALEMKLRAIRDAAKRGAAA